MTERKKTDKENVSFFLLSQHSKFLYQLYQKYKRTLKIPTFCITLYAKRFIKLRLYGPSVISVVYAGA